MSPNLSALVAFVEQFASPELTNAVKQAYDLGAQEVEIARTIVTLAERDALNAIQGMIGKLKPGS